MNIDIDEEEEEGEWAEEVYGLVLVCPDTIQGDKGGGHVDFKLDLQGLHEEVRRDRGLRLLFGGDSRFNGRGGKIVLPAAGG